MSKVELDAQSRKVRRPTRPPPAAPSRARFQTATPPPPQAVLVALLRAISQMKPILDAGDRGHLKDLVLASRMQAKVLSLGIQLAILDHDTQFDSPEADEANLDKRRSILTQLIGLLRGGDGPGGNGREDGDDYESDFEEDDMMMPDGDAVADGDARSNDADVDAGPYGDEDDDSDDDFDGDGDGEEGIAADDPRILDLARTVAQQKELLQQKMDFVKEQLSMLNDLKASCQQKLDEAMEGRSDEEDDDDEDPEEDDEDYDDDDEEDDDDDEGDDDREFDVDADDLAQPSVAA